MPANFAIEACRAVEAENDDDVVGGAAVDVHDDQ